MCHTYYAIAGTTPVLVHNCGKDQGIHEFPDMHNPGKTYVGKSINLTNRLESHVDIVLVLDDPGTPEGLLVIWSRPAGSLLHRRGWPDLPYHLRCGRRRARRRLQRGFWCRVKVSALHEFGVQVGVA